MALSHGAISELALAETSNEGSLSAAVAQTLGAATLAGAGTVIADGALNATLGGATIAATGALGILPLGHTAIAWPLFWLPLR